jgi:hypothetical protein
VFVIQFSLHGEHNFHIDPIGVAGRVERSPSLLVGTTGIAG